MEKCQIKTILLTGATGFLGSHLLAELCARGYKILVLKRSFSSLVRISSLLKNPLVKTYDIDVTPPARVFEENKVDAVIHCATNYGRTENSCAQLLQTNLMFPITLLDLCVEHKTGLFINTDSYFNKDNLSYSYLLNYSLSKKSLNLWLKYFSKRIKIINMILEHMYGEFDGKDKFVEFAMQKIAIEQVSELNLTAGEQKRDFIYVGDVCKVYLAALEWADKNAFEYKNFDVGTGIATPLADFVRVIKEASSSPTKLNFGALAYRADEIVSSAADLGSLTELNITEFTSILQGIVNIIDVYKTGQK